jgi:alanine racemase
MPRPLLATIDISAMRHNLSIAKQHAAGAKAWAVVKANAYGHGLAFGMKGFADAEGLALIEPDAAVRLREMGWTKPVLLLEGFFEPADLAVVERHGLDVVIHNDEQIDMLENAALASPLRVHLKMNSGMNRLGFRPETYRAAYARLRAIDAVSKISFITHLANADDPANPRMPFGEQVRRFQDVCNQLSGERSIANSAANLLNQELSRDWVRPGIMLYGGSPGGKSAAEFGLRPAMTLTSEIIGLQTIQAGEAIGYGSCFVATRKMSVGVVACGYADGYPRHAPNGTPVLVDGKKTAIVGRVSMDMLSVDLSDIPGARVGSKVTLWGDDLPIDDVANAAGTIGYELMCALAPRVRVVER